MAFRYYQSPKAIYFQIFCDIYILFCVNNIYFVFQTAMNNPVLSELGKPEASQNSDKILMLLAQVQ